MVTKDDFYLGQKLYLVPSDKRDREEYVKVEKIGRKYITLQDGSVIELEEDGLNRRFYKFKDYGVIGKFYFGQEEYLEQLEIKRLKDNLQDRISQIDKNPESHCLLKKIDKLLDSSNEKEAKKFYYALQWKSGSGSNNHGIFQSLDQAIESIYAWWALNDFTPKYIRQWTANEVTTIDYGFHNAFYKVTKVSEDNFVEVLGLGW